MTNTLNYLKTKTLSEMDNGAFLVIPEENGFSGCPEIRIKTDRNDVIGGYYVPVTVDIQTGLTSYGFPIKMRNVGDLIVHPIDMPDATMLCNALREENYSEDMKDIMAEASESM